MRENAGNRRRSKNTAAGATGQSGVAAGQFGAVILWLWEAVMERASASGITLAGFYVAAKVKFCEMGVIPAANCAASITASHNFHNLFGY
jgi:CHASE2 domain-containing sensor protein